MHDQGMAAVWHNYPVLALDTGRSVGGVQSKARAAINESFFMGISGANLVRSRQITMLWP